MNIIVVGLIRKILLNLIDGQNNITKLAYERSSMIE
jgi:hypothetical protein